MYRHVGRDHLILGGKDKFENFQWWFALVFGKDLAGNDEEQLNYLWRVGQFNLGNDGLFTMGYFSCSVSN